jgi:alcohol dehydrogenase
MKELIYVAPSKLEWREGPDPVLAAPEQALVRPIASAFCDLDRRISAGLTPFPPGFAIGHEAVGEVVEVGSSVTDFRRGDLVSIPWKIACGQCSQCLFGRSSACTAVRRHASYGTPVGGQWGGLFSELVNVPFADAMLVSLPKGVEPASVASVSDNLTDAWVAARRPMAAGRKDARVLVVGGTESLGVLATQLSVAAGAAQVTYFDSDPIRSELAAKAGASIHQGDERALHEQFDFTISATRDPDKLRASLLALAPGGHCSCIGVIFEDPKMPLFSMYLRDVTFSVGLCSVRPHMPRVLELVATGQCDPMSLTTIVSTDEAPEALAAHAGKVVVVRPRMFSE